MVHAVIQEAVKPLQAEITSLKSEVNMLKTRLAETKAMANDNEQYSRRNNIRIFELPEEAGENCYDLVLGFCENELKINMTREEVDRAHRVGKPKQIQESNLSLSTPRAMIVKLTGHSDTGKVFRIKKKEDLFKHRLLIPLELRHR